MAAFIPKKLPLEETFGEKLRQARQKKNFRIEEASRRVKIKPDYLVALEAEDWDRLPAGMYGKNFLKEYAVFLGLDGNEAAAYWNNRRDDSRPEDPFAQKIVSRKRFLIFPKICRNILAAAALLACFLYLIFYFKNIVSAPELVVSSPDKNLLLETTSLIVSGQTEA
jgi:cytoskeletal protein RodZ